MSEQMDERYGLDTPQEEAREATDLRKKYEALEKDRDGWKSTVESIALMAGMAASETWGVLDILTHVREMREENADLKAQVARLSAPVSDEEPDTCEGCDKPLREDEGHETEDMVILCDECWQELLDDLGWHSEECPCDTCIASRTTKGPK